MGKKEYKLHHILFMDGILTMKRDKTVKSKRIKLLDGEVMKLVGH